MFWRNIAWLLALAWPLTAACSEPPPCVAGRQLACQCNAASKGARRCNAQGKLGACECSSEDFGSGARPELKRRGKRADAGAPDADATEQQQPPVTLWTGSTKIVELFVHEVGVIVVLQDAVVLVDRTGRELTRVQAARYLNAAAFAGDVLCVLDGPTLKFLDVASGLSLVSERAEPGASANMVMISADRLVSEVNQELHTYSARTGELLGTDATVRLPGRAWRRVPVSDRFVISDESAYRLYEVGKDHIARLISRSGSLDLVGSVFGFDDSPAQYLITGKGVMLSLRNCNDDDAGVEDLCLPLAGALGYGTFVAMDTAAGRLVGAQVRDEYGDKHTLLRSFDVESRTIVSERDLLPDADYASHLRFDHRSSRVVLGFRALDLTLYRVELHAL